MLYSLKYNQVSGNSEEVTYSTVADPCTYKTVEIKDGDDIFLKDKYDHTHLAELSLRCDKEHTKILNLGYGILENMTALEKLALDRVRVIDDRLNDLLSNCTANHIVLRNMTVSVLDLEKICSMKDSDRIRIMMYDCTIRDIVGYDAAEVKQYIGLYRCTIDSATDLPVTNNSTLSLTPITHFYMYDCEY